MSAFIKTYHTCQLTGKRNQTVSPAPLCPIPALDQLFEYFIMDCVDLLPTSKYGNQYFLILMCQATRYSTELEAQTLYGGADGKTQFEKKSPKKMTSFFDCEAKQQQFSPLDQVIFFLSLEGSPF